MRKELGSPAEERVPGSRVAAALLGAILAVSAASIFTRLAQEQAPSLVIAALRLTFATVLLAPLAWVRYRGELQSLTRREVMLMCISGLFLAAHFATWISSLEYTTVASSVVFVSTGPLWVALLAPVLLNERLKPAAIAGLLAALAGGTLIGLSDACRWEGGPVCRELGQVLEGGAMRGNFLALIGAWTISGYLILGRKLRARRSLSLISYIFPVYGAAAAALLVAMRAAGQSPFGYPAQTYGWILLLAVFPQLVGHSTYNWALRYLPASLVAVTTLGEPVGSAILAYLLLQETPAIVVVGGGILILSGIYLAARQ